jgi:hypothetical protein
MEKGEEKLQQLEKNKHSFCMHIAKCHDLKAEVKKWIMDHRNNRNTVSINIIIIFEARRWAVVHSITDFAGTAAWC